MTLLKSFPVTFTARPATTAALILWQDPDRVCWRDWRAKTVVPDAGGGEGQRRLRYERGHQVTLCDSFMK